MGTYAITAIRTGCYSNTEEGKPSVLGRLGGQQMFLEGSGRGRSEAAKMAAPLGE